jgi:amidase
MVSNVSFTVPSILSVPTGTLPSDAWLPSPRLVFVAGPRPDDMGITGDDTVLHVPAAGSTWITPLREGWAGIRVAVKDLIDVDGCPTTAGCRAVADRAGAAGADAACLAGLRAAVDGGRAILVGKANLHELADGISGVNAWFGTPVNPCDPDRVPGGSSSGSATAIGHGEADVAIGTDTAGSVRIPAACCGVAGMKTTAGRIPLAGVWPLAPSLDTVGPMAADVAGVARAMALLEPGFRPDPVPLGPVARLRPLDTDRRPLLAAPWIEEAMDAALAAAGLDVVEMEVPGWIDAAQAALRIIGAEAAALHGALAREHPSEVGDDVARSLARGAGVGGQALAQARSLALRWRARLERDLLAHHVALVLPVLDDVAPRLDGDTVGGLTVRWTAPVNLAGLPALALPVPLGPGGRRTDRPPMPGALQLVGPAGGEEGLLALGAVIEAAVATL